MLCKRFSSTRLAVRGAESKSSSLAYWKKFAVLLIFFRIPCERDVFFVIISKQNTDEAISPAISPATAMEMPNCEPLFAPAR